MRSLFVNLPVTSAAASREFFLGLGLGFTVNETYSGPDTVSLGLEDNLTFMMLEEAKFAEFVNAGIADAHSAQEVLLCLSCDSREEVDRVVDRAVATGGKPWKPSFEAGPMYGGSFQDPDGHVWELAHMPA